MFRQKSLSQKCFDSDIVRNCALMKKNNIIRLNDHQ